jgi:hypothetical protein
MQEMPLIEVVFENLRTKTATADKVNIPATAPVFKGCSRLQTDSCGYRDVMGKFKKRHSGIKLKRKLLKILFDSS